MTPDGAFYDLGKLPSWTQYTLSSRSLLKALEVDDPEETLMIQLTISELSMVSFGLLVISRLFPEFLPLASDLSVKVTEVSEAQDFLGSGSLDEEA